MDKELTKNIIKSAKAIRKKYKQIKTGQIESDIMLEKNLQPITEPLKRIVAEIKQKPIKK